MSAEESLEAFWEYVKEREREEKIIPIIDAGHYGTEYIFMKAMRKILEEKYPSLQITCAKVKSPYMIL